MALGHRYKTRRRPVNGVRKKSAPKSEDLVSPKIPRPRRIHSFNTATIKDRPSSPQALTARLVTRAETKKLIVEPEPPQEQPQGDSPSAIIPATTSREQVATSQIQKDLEAKYHPDKTQRREHVPVLKLTTRNLKTLQRQLNSPSTEMSPSSAARGGQRGGGKRGGKRGGKSRARTTRTGVTPDLPEERTTETTTTWVSPACYRYGVLEKVKIFIQYMAPPADIHSKLAAIFNREISNERLSEISNVAKHMSKEFARVVRANYREDDWNEVVISALKALDTGSDFGFARKAGIVLSNTLTENMVRVLTFDLDFNPNLKPKLPSLLPVNNESDNTSDRPTKRRRVETPSGSSSDTPHTEAMESAIEEPVVVIKTPRPDCTIGLAHDTVAQALLDHGIDELQVDSLLSTLESEHFLYSNPVGDMALLRFPTLVIEGKAYSTGKTPFEAENQAAGAASCMINLYQQLTDVHNCYAPSSPHEKIAPLAFSITFVGPTIEVSVHYTVVKNNVTAYHMSVLDVYCATVIKHLETLVIVLEQIMRWNKEDVLPEIASQLAAIAKGR
ncbi:hypothetical protein AYO21_06758 [Fonsecaea monophora]|uniref:DUF7924 domain-containing protein n=1 Tax=Fonsecaea monophora TaxID=254056 RepID=A0A177F475_9EURO|nr:hypothetical protein AYO21_06758 [Fonsecaea monophora]OAG39038.1 hypothetical protein AYO21_06758 [Fonsecaea monophora]